MYNNFIILRANKKFHSIYPSSFLKKSLVFYLLFWEIWHQL